MTQVHSKVALALLLVGAVSPVRAEPIESPLVAVCDRFSKYDWKSDGRREIQSLQLRASHTAKKPAGRMVMFVEKRLLEGDSDNTLHPAVDQWAKDLAREGYAAEVLAIEFATDDLHRDGEYLLALREVLRVLHRDHELAGVVLVGRFPDAFLVRSCNWHKQGAVTLRKKKPDEKKYEKVHYLARVPEPIAPRADIVLADLDGNWEDLYVRESTELPSVAAVLEDRMGDDSSTRCVDVEVKSKRYEDFFHIADGELKVIPSRARANRPPMIRLGERKIDLECTRGDAKLPNAIAHPEILVSRINAAGIAWKPREDIRGEEGKQLLDDEGRPQLVKFASEKQVPDWRSGIWEADAEMELRLLVDYFARNHAYRTGVGSIAWRPSAISCDLPSGYRVMRHAADDWHSHDDRRMADVRHRPQLTDFAAWMSYPAVLRTIRAHSFPQGSQFRDGDAEELDELVEEAGACWSWTPRGDHLEPSLAASSERGMFNWFLMRTLWENGQVAEEPAFYHHTGCNSVTPASANRLPFHHRDYGRYQSAEALLLMGNGLSLVGRAKVYYDEPRGFVDALRRGESFGSAWADYFAYESGAKGDKHNRSEIDRKRSYFWSVLGDATLTLKKPMRNSADDRTANGRHLEGAAADTMGGPARS